MVSSIRQIRETRHVPAYIGRLVSYAGHPYRIAWARAGGLVLRSQLLVHPTDENLRYHVSPKLNEQSNQRRIEQLESQLEELRHRIKKVAMVAEYSTPEKIKAHIEKVLTTYVVAMIGQNNPPLGWHIAEEKDGVYQCACGVQLDFAGRVYTSTSDEIAWSAVCEECRKIKGAE